jgi:hypothetical protein
MIEYIHYKQPKHTYKNKKEYYIQKAKLNSYSPRVKRISQYGIIWKHLLE